MHVYNGLLSELMSYFATLSVTIAATTPKPDPELPPGPHWHLTT